MSTMDERIKDVEELLESAAKMDNFIHTLANCKLDNCSGSAYRKVRICNYGDGILLQSDHNVNSYCYIKICTVPTTKVRSGCRDGCAYEDPSPKPIKGEFVTVWNSGAWTKRGPWEEKIRARLLKLIEDVSEAKRRKELDEQKKEEQKKACQDEKDLALERAWRAQK